MPRSTAHPGSVDEHDRTVLGLDQGVDRVAGRPGQVVDDGTVVTDETVEQRRLADVRPSDDGDAWGVEPLRCRLEVGVTVAARRRRPPSCVVAVLREALDDHVEEVPARRPCRALTGYGSPSPSAMNSQLSFSRRSLSALLATRMTSCPPRRSQSATASSSSVTPTDASTTNSTTSASPTAASTCLETLASSDAARAAGHPAAGVDDAERDAEPFRLEDLAIAGHPRTVLDDRRLLADDAVEQRRLADVRPAHDGDEREVAQRPPSLPQPSASRRARPSVAITSTGRGSPATLRRRGSVHRRTGTRQGGGSGARRARRRARGGGRLRPSAR